MLPDGRSAPVHPAIRGVTVLCAWLAAFTGGARAQDPSGRSDESLGRVDFAASCAAPVRADLDRGVALLHHMTYPLAQATFERVTVADPSCAVGYWGMAMTMFQPLWPTRPSDADLRAGWAAVQQGLRVGAPTQREGLYMATAEAFFDPEGDPDYWTRIARWADATATLYEAHPEDHDAASLFALAQLATAPLTGNAVESHRRAADLLLAVHREEPTHPGAVHYTIHANDIDGRERETPEIVRSYGDIAPRNPHALHMPTHVFVRLGQWPDVISWNERAAEAALEQRVGDGGRWVWDEYPHAVEYLLYAHLQRGDDARAEETLRRLQATADLQPTFKTAFHLASTAARYTLERRAWSEAERLPPRASASLEWDLFPWPEAITWFARGLGATRNGSPDAGRESLERLRGLRARAETQGEDVFTRQVEILRLELAAWLARSSGNDRRAVDLMQQAVALEVSTPKHAVTPAPTLPPHELLGDLLMEIGDADGALEAYRTSLARTPGRFNGLLGAARAADALGDADAARTYYGRLVELSSPQSSRAGLAEARAYVARR